LKRYPWAEFWVLWGSAVALSAILLALTGMPLTLGGYFLWSRHPQTLPAWPIGLCVIAVEFAIATGLGLFAAHRVGLGAPVSEKILNRERAGPALRALLRPVLLLAVLLALCAQIPHLSLFHPNREAEIRFVEQVAHTPAAQKLQAEMPASRPLNPLSAILSYLDGAMDGELVWRLFLVSLLAWALSRAVGQPRGTASPRVLWTSIIVVAILSATYVFRQQHSAHQMFLAHFQGMAVPQDPQWLVALRVALDQLPGALALGWLYVRYGIESAILSSFAADLIERYLLLYLYIYFT
jgi:hypothetical protein